ncbi:UNVERIFIED_CONTAM: hypothetical protein FKN15_064387 [Acipenser sinensis]
MAKNDCDQNVNGVELGFVEESESFCLRSKQFHSKVGGRPAWLSQSGLPSPSELCCLKCGQPSAFLLQVYAPIPRQARSFHRTCFVFCCKNTACYSHNDSRCFKGVVGVSLLDHKFLFLEYEVVTEPEELQLEADSDGQIEEEQLKESEPPASDVLESMDEKDLEAMAKHESKESKVFEKFKRRTAIEPEQVLRYCRMGRPLWVSDENVPKETDIPNCLCGAKRLFEFQIMPQLLNYLKVDSPDASIDWGTLVVYTCAESCDQGNKYTAEFILKQDYGADHI